MSRFAGKVLIGALMWFWERSSSVGVWVTGVIDLAAWTRVRGRGVAACEAAEVEKGVVWGRARAAGRNSVYE